MSADLLAARALAEGPAPVDAADKRRVFRDLTTARAAFGLSGRTLTVLNAPLSFHPQTELDGDAPIIVFPSKRSLADRAHGMSEATLRRHLAALVAGGLILRHDSPNGKRYAARDASGDIALAFGFDLRPLLVRAVEIAQAAREAADRLRRARETVVLMLPDADKLADHGRETGRSADWPGIEADLVLLRRALRRRLTIEETGDLHRRTARALGDAEKACATSSSTEKTSGNATESERHYQNSVPDSLESDLRREMARVDPACLDTDGPATAGQGRDESDGGGPPLAVVPKACPSLTDCFPDPVRSWRDFIGVAGDLRACLGISPDAWREAVGTMGAATAAIAVACML